MKIKSLFLIVLFTTSQIIMLSGQDTIVKYYNKNDKKIRKATKASYYRQIINNKNTWIVNEYNINGTKRMSGIYKDKKCTNKNGKFICFYSSGQIKSIKNFSNNSKNGKWSKFYENGNKDFEISYKNDKKIGEWLWYFENGQLSAKENYINDKRVNATFWNEKGVEIDIKQAEFPPTFRGGDIQTFHKWVNTQIAYPSVARENGFQGDEVVKFYVDKYGKTGVIKIIKSVHSSIDENIIYIINSSPLWKAGKLHGRLFKYTYELKTSYKLE